MTTNMEGVLWKWTNYLSGWQPRWFVLESGILSYYKSQEDVNNGCKGSIKMSACDIKVHPTDNTRLDLIIPSEQHYYVKAAQPQERQSWLIALGSAKAKYSQTSTQEPIVTGGELTPDVMRSKKSELRLYCDLLMQQVHSVKQSVTPKEEGQTATPDVEKLNEATSLLSATCDTFIQTLDEVMKLVQEAPIPGEPVIPSSPKRSLSMNSRMAASRTNSVDKSARNRQSSSSSIDGPQVKSNRRSRTGSEGSHSDVSLSEPASGPVTSRVNPSTSNSPGPKNLLRKDGNGVDAARGSRGAGEGVNGDDGEGPDDFKDAIDTRIPTFFSTMPSSFVHIHLLDNEGVPVEPFLDACRALVPIFDKLNSTAFAPVKLDFAGNIKKIHQKQKSTVEGGSPGFTSLQEMVLSEVKARQHTNSNSATVALLWLKRGLEFIREFLREVCSGGPDLSECATNAYTRTLKNYHGWVVRGVFAVAVKALPYRDEFLSHLVEGEEEEEEESEAADDSLLRTLMADMELYLQHLDRNILTIDRFYTKHQLHTHEQV